MKRHKIVLQYNAPFSLTFALISLGALILGIVTDGATTAKYFSVYRAPLTDPLTYLRFFSHVLGHASVAHYTGNIILILVLGPSLEENYGSYTILFATLITALVAGLIHFIFFSNALLGASGIVFMMLIMASLGGMRSGGIPLTLLFVFIFYIGGEIYDGFVLADNVSQLTHIVGGICGAVLGIIIRNKK